MIRVVIRRRHDRLIDGFTVSGHADYHIPGKDIVCSGVSAVTIGTVNAAEALLKTDLKPQVKHGYLKASMPEVLDKETLERLQLLLESMLVMLKGIESSYGSYVKIEEKLISQ